MKGSCCLWLKEVIESYPKLSSEMLSPDTVWLAIQLLCKGTSKNYCKLSQCWFLHSWRPSRSYPQPLSCRRWLLRHSTWYGPLCTSSCSYRWKSSAQSYWRWSARIRYLKSKRCLPLGQEKGNPLSFVCWESVQFLQISWFPLEAICPQEQRLRHQSFLKWVFLQ